MELFNSYDSETSEGAYSPQVAQQESRRRFTLPEQNIRGADIAEAVRVASVEVGRPVTSKEIQQRFGMRVRASTYLSHAYKEGLVMREGRTPSDSDRSAFAYFTNDLYADTALARWGTCDEVARLFGVAPRTLRLWAEQGKVERRGTGKQTEYRMAAWLPTKGACLLLDVSRRTLQRRAQDGSVIVRYRGSFAEWLVTDALIHGISKTKRPRTRTEIAPVNEAQEVLKTKERVTLRDVLAIVLAWIASVLGVNR